MPDDHRRRILAGIERVLAEPPVRLLSASPGRGLPPGDPPLAQPRLMLLLSGRHRVEIAGAGAPQMVRLDRATGLALAAGAWLRRRHDAPFSLLGVVFHRGFPRLLINRHGGGAVAGPARIWHHTRRPPPPALWRQFAVLTDPDTPEAMRQPGLLALLHGCRALLADDTPQDDAGRGAALHQAMLAACVENLAGPLDRGRLARRPYAVVVPVSASGRCPRAWIGSSRSGSGARYGCSSGYR